MENETRTDKRGVGRELVQGQETSVGRKRLQLNKQQKARGYKVGGTTWSVNQTTDLAKNSERDAWREKMVL